MAEATGISPAEQDRVEQHVALAEQYPFMQRPGWVRQHVLEAGAAISRVPVADRSAIAALVDQDAVPPRTRIDILKNVVGMAPAAWAHVIALTNSNDVHDRRTAQTAAAALPPPADPGQLLLGETAEVFHRAVTRGRRHPRKLCTFGFTAMPAC